MRPIKNQTGGMMMSAVTVMALALVGMVGGGIALYFKVSSSLPNIITPQDYKPPLITKIIAKNAADKWITVGEFAEEKREVIPFEKIPKHLVQAFLAAEDDQFYQHSGINWLSILRATAANLKAGHVVQGGSTITQQVAKSLLLTSERSLIRKAKEALLAYRIEHNLTKDQILYLYLNQIYFGQGAYGVEVAAQTYFHKHASEVDVAEAAILAGLPQAPGKAGPHQNPKKAKERQQYVLKRMLENKFITEKQHKEALDRRLRIYEEEGINAKYGAYLVEHVRRHLEEKYGEEALKEKGYTVYLPATVEGMVAAHRSVQEGLRQVDKRMGYRGPLEKIADPKAQEEFLSKQHKKLADKKIGFQVLMTDGHLSIEEAMKEVGIQSPQQLLDEGEVYTGIVSEVDDKTKLARIRIGYILAEIPIEKLRWARESKDFKPVGPEISRVSQVLSPGDVILVRVDKKADTKIIASLEQEPKVQGALLSLEVQTGYVLAMEGGYSFLESQLNRSLQAQRQVGSSFKPIIFAAAIERGFTPASMIVDAPIVYEDKDFGKWKPGNFEEKFYGDTMFRLALVKSRNVPTIKIVQQVTVPYISEFAKRLGLKAQLPMDLSMSLGSASIALEEMVRLYSVFPRLGKKVEPIFFTQIVDRDGKILEKNIPNAVKASAGVSPSPAQSTTSTLPVSPQPNAPTPTIGVGIQAPTFAEEGQALDPRVAYVMTHLMKEVVSFGTGHEAKNLGRISAGKTGTTNDYVDAWYIGFTPSVVTGSWVGFDTPRTINHLETGARAALPIWLGYMQQVAKQYPDVDFPVPPGVVFASIDPETGKLASPQSARAIREAFVEGTQPTETSGTMGKTRGKSSTDFLKEDAE